MKNIRRDYSKAEEFYQRAVEADPKHANSLGNYAIFLQEVRHDPMGAISYLERSLEINPRKGNLKRMIALLEGTGGDTEKLEHYRALLRKVEASEGE